NASGRMRGDRMEATGPESAKTNRQTVGLAPREGQEFVFLEDFFIPRCRRTRQLFPLLVVRSAEQPLQLLPRFGRALLGTLPAAAAEHRLELGARVDLRRRLASEHRVELLPRFGRLPSRLLGEVRLAREV